MSVSHLSVVWNRIHYAIECKISSILYHSTSLYGLYKILDTNTFQMSPVLGSNSDNRFQNKAFFLSLTRSRVGQFHYPTHELHSGTALLVIDGDLLERHGFSGGPVNYWGPDYKHVKNEMEDRIISDKPEIPNAMKFIKEIHIYSVSTSDNFIRTIRQAIILAKKNHIPCYVYSSAKDFNLLRKDKANIKPLNLETKEVPERWPTTRVPNWFKGYSELLFKNKESELDEEGKYILYRFRRDYDNRDCLRDLKDHIQSTRSGSGRDSFIKFFNYMQRLKLKTAKDVVDFIRNKWHTDK